MPNDKLKRLIHFICRECGNDPACLGKVRLQKILFLSDLWRFKLRARTISESTYFKYPFGPFNKEIDSLLLELQNEGKLTIIPRSDHDEYDNVGLVGKGQPDLTGFEDREINVIKENIEYVCGHTATEISEKTHGPVWKMGEMHEELPFEAYVATSLTNTTQDDVNLAASLEE